MIEALLVIRDELEQVALAEDGEQEPHLWDLLADLDEVIRNYAGGTITLETVKNARFNIADNRE